MKLGVDVGFHGTRHSTDPRPFAQVPHRTAPAPAFRRQAGRAGALESRSLRRAVFYLYVTAPGMAARKLSLDRPVTTVGRSSMNDLPISDKMLSRQHARIVRDSDGAFTVEDLGSRNGTFLNGERLTTVQPLKPGDRITVGGVTLKGRVGVDDPRAHRRRRRRSAGQHDPQGVRGAVARARLGDRSPAARRAARQADRIAARRQRAHDRAPARHLGGRAPAVPDGQGLRDAEAGSRPGAPALARHRRARARGRARGGGDLRGGHPALQDAGGRRRREAQRPAPHGHLDGLGRLARRLDPSVGHQVGARGAARERGRGRRTDLRRLPRRATAPSRRRTCAC